MSANNKNHTGDKSIPEDIHNYEHKPFKCLNCGNTVIAIGLWGYCEVCESNYLMLDEDIPSSNFQIHQYKTENNYFIETDESGTNPRWNFGTLPQKQKRENE